MHVVLRVRVHAGRSQRNGMMLKDAFKIKLTE